MRRRFIFLALLSLGLLIQASPMPLLALALGSSGLAPAAIPDGIVPIAAADSADFNSDGLLERLEIMDGRLSILSGDQPAWQSLLGWTVVQAQVTDLDRDGSPEAALLLWRSFRPWPVDQWLPSGGRIDSFQDDRGDSCHFILIGWRQAGFRELWAGSALAEPFRSFAAADLDGDGSQELVTLEGSYSDPRPTPAHALKVWEWNGFGFSVVSSYEGSFSHLVLVRTHPGRILILVP